MSTLKVATIQDTSGNNSSTPSEVAQGRAKAWVNFQGYGTVTIRDSFNVTSITDNGTGDFLMTFATAMPNANYAVGGSAAELNSTGTADWFMNAGRDSNYSDLRTAAATVICTTSAGGNAIDAGIISAIVFSS